MQSKKSLLFAGLVLLIAAVLVPSVANAAATASAGPIGPEFITLRVEVDGHLVRIAAHTGQMMKFTRNDGLTFALVARPSADVDGIKVGLVEIRKHEDGSESMRHRRSFDLPRFTQEAIDTDLASNMNVSLESVTVPVDEAMMSHPVPLLPCENCCISCDGWNYCGCAVEACGGKCCCGRICCKDW